MRVFTASLVENPIPKCIKVAVFMNGLKVGPSNNQLFRVHANTMDEAIQIALQEGTATDMLVFLRRCDRITVRCQAQCKELQQLELAQGRADGARHGGLAPESLGALETRKSSGGLIVVHASTVARNGDKYADALRESKGRGQVSVRLADGTVVNEPGVRMDLAVKFEDFDNTESFLVLDMDKYDLILGMPWLEKMVARALTRPEKYWESLTPMKVLRPNAESRRAVWASTVATVAMPDGTDQAGNIGPQAAEAAEEIAAGVSCVGPQAADAAGEDAESASGVVPHSESETPPARPVEEQCHVFDGVSGHQVKAGAVRPEALPEVSALMNLEELSMKDFLAELKAGEIAEMVLLKPETSPEDLSSPSVMDEDVREGFTKQHETCPALEILKNP
ncbi:Pol protein, partial [Phytophthora palmivora]